MNVEMIKKLFKALDDNVLYIYGLYEYSGGEYPSEASIVLLKETEGWYHFGKLESEALKVMDENLAKDIVKEMKPL